MTDTSAPGRFAEFDFRVGRVTSRSLSLLSKHWLSFSIIAALVYLPSLAMVPARELFAPGGRPAASVSTEMVVLVLLVAFAMFVLFFLTQAVIVHAAFQALRGQRVDLVQSAKIALRRFFPILGIMIVWVLALSVLSIATGAAGGVLALTLGAPLLTLASPVAVLLVTAILVAVWFVSLQACVIERTGVFRSLWRSAQLTKRHRLRVFGLFLAVLIVGLFVGIVLGALTGAAALIVGTGVAKAITFVWQGLWGAWYATTGVVAYHDLRVAKEGIHSEEIASVFD